MNLQNRGTLNLDDEVATAAQASGLGGHESGYAQAAAQNIVPARDWQQLSTVRMWLQMLMAGNVRRTPWPVNGYSDRACMV